MTVNNNKFIFKVLSLGNFTQELSDKVMMLNRPCIRVDEQKKKWGNEYLIFSKEHDGRMINQLFLGAFGIDQKKKKNLKLFKNLGIPVKPDYFILVMDHTGERFVKDYDIIKANQDSYSMIFSSAFHSDDEGKTFKCQTMFIVQNGDLISMNKEAYRFSAKNEAFEKA